MASTVLQTPGKGQSEVIRQGVELTGRVLSGAGSISASANIRNNLNCGRVHGAKVQNRFQNITRNVVYAMMTKALSLVVVGALLLGVLQAIRLGLGRRLSVR